MPPKVARPLAAGGGIRPAGQVAAATAAVAAGVAVGIPGQHIVITGIAVAVVVLVMAVLLSMADTVAGRVVVCLVVAFASGRCPRGQQNIWASTTMAQSADASHALESGPRLQMASPPQTDRLY